MTKVQTLYVFAVVMGIATANAQENQITGQPVIDETSTLTKSISPTEINSVKYKADVEVYGEAFSITDNYFKEGGAFTDIVPHINARYNSWLALDFQFELFFRSANTESRFTQEGKATRALFIDSAALVVNPLPGLTLSGGIIYQAINPIRSIVSEEGSAGASEKYEIPINPQNKFILIASELIPNSGTVTPGIIDDAPSAFFLTQTLEYEADIKALRTEVKMAVTHFEYGNLSSNVASDSMFIGNDIRSFSGIGPNTHFSIGFSGLESSAEAVTHLDRTLNMKLGTSIIQNTEAPSDRNFGAQGFVELTAKLGNIKISPALKYFKVGADVTPATYTILPYRYFDRQGFTVGMAVELIKEKITFFGNYTNSSLILPSRYLANREMYYLGLEAKYDVL